MSELFYPKFQELIDKLSKAVSVPIQTFDLGEGLVSYEYENNDTGKILHGFINRLFPYATCKTLIIRKAPTINPEGKYWGFTIVTGIKSSDVYFSPGGCRFGVSVLGPIVNTLIWPHPTMDWLEQVFLFELERCKKISDILVLDIETTKRNLAELQREEQEIKTRADFLTEAMEKAKMVA